MASNKRAENFTQDEIDILVGEVLSRKHIVNASFSSTVTKSVKKNAWEEIARAVTRVDGKERNEEDVKKKMTALKCETKKRHTELKRERNMTGGGPAPDELSKRDLLILEFIGEVAVSGINGGMETALFPQVEFGAGGDPLDTLASLASNMGTPGRPPLSG